MNWIYGLALASVFIGFVNGINMLKSMRTAKHPQAEIAWQQPAISYWRYETTNMVAITINDLGLTCLAALLLISSINNNILTFSLKSGMELLLTLAVLFGIVLTANMIGLSLAFHFARQWIQPVSYGICDDGILYGGHLVNWKSYSYYEIGPDDGLISLYSSYSPSIRTWVLKPPSESYLGILGVIQKNLPSSPPAEETTSWYRSPFALILGITILNLIFSLPAIWGLGQDKLWVWAYAFTAFFIVQVTSGQIITIFDGRGKYPAKQVMTK